jgi:hypothetical protein
MLYRDRFIKMKFSFGTNASRYKLPYALATGNPLELTAESARVAFEARAENAVSRLLYRDCFIEMKLFFVTDASRYKLAYALPTGNPLELTSGVSSTFKTSEFKIQNSK